MNRLEKIKDLAREYQRAGESEAAALGDHVENLIASAEYDQMPEHEAIALISGSLEELSEVALGMRDEVNALGGIVKLEEGNA